jgi:osmotically-inducible protein OsmY
MRQRIVAALHREEDIDAKGITVSLSGHTVTLKGRVRTWHEHEAAERAAMHAPGVLVVDNLLEVAAPQTLGTMDDSEIC